MTNSAKPFHERILSGSDRSLSAALLRVALATVEPAYATVMRVRNFAYEHRLKKIQRLPLPTISVGNLTTGGTGKTPIIRWLAEYFIQHNLTPAILMRGYRSESTGGSDEQKMLQSYLGQKAHIIANPDRKAACAFAENQSPKPNLVLLDDAYQHRKIHRDFNLLLISAINPLGYNHVLPRGYLREPLSGIKRADAIVITRANQVSTNELSSLKLQISEIASDIPIYESSHTLTHFLRNTNLIPIEDLPARHIVFSGIASPQSFYAQFPAALATHGFPDHHAYTERDLDRLRASADQHRADILITTEKDWTKLAALHNLKNLPPIYRAQLQIAFARDDESRLLAQINASVKPRSPAAWRGPSAQAAST